ncbi:MAG: Fe-S cluster assembly protein NifU [Victivallales bacterium]|nr:Fe-S cluster assembly protein NifU [Victivallales bacterium]
MWEYTDKVKDHFQNPRNVGLLEDADGIGEVGNIICGDAMKLSVKLTDDKKRIADARFQTFGCASAIASASALTEILKGKSVEEAAKLTNQDIADYLGSLPEAKMHCSVMGMEAFQAALSDIRKKHPEYQLPGTNEPEGMDRVVCQCFNVTEGKIREVIRLNHLKTVEQVTFYTKAGGGCGGCYEDIQQILDNELAHEHLAKEANAVQAQAARLTKSAQQTVKENSGPLTPFQKMRLIQQVFDDEIRPGLKADGGDAEIVDVAADTVQVRLQGKCAKCAIADKTIEHWIEAKLREKVSPAISVTQVE